jgi:pSer/pThr/pTyr-binding forkhead associated (FHA) protein
MAKIIVNRESFQVEELELKQGTLSIGRSRDNELCLDDLTISHHHARIVTVFDSSYVEDLGSTNGIYVNGKKTKTHTLHNGDVLTLGHYQVLFRAETAASPQPDANATLMIDTAQLAAQAAKAKQQTRTPPPVLRPHPAPPKSPKNVPPLAASPTPAPAPAMAATLPDIEDSATLLEEHEQPRRDMRKLRRSDVSPVFSLKVIVLAILAAVATFSLLLVFTGWKPG